MGCVGDGLGVDFASERLLTVGRPTGFSWFFLHFGAICGKFVG